MAWTIEQCRVTEVESIWVSSDSDNILQVASEYGAKQLYRPKEISNDEASSESAWIHALDYIKSQSEKRIDAILAPQVTSPIREPEDFSRAINTFTEENLDSLFSCLSPEIKFYWEKNGTEFRSVNYDYKNRPRRQDIKSKQYIENGSFYIFKPKVLENQKNRLGGKIGVYEMPEWKSFEIDNITDFKLCEAVMKSFVL